MTSTEEGSPSGVYCKPMILVSISIYFDYFSITIFLLSLTSVRLHFSKQSFKVGKRWLYFANSKIEAERLKGCISRYLFMSYWEYTFRSEIIFSIYSMIVFTTAAFSRAELGYEKGKGWSSQTWERTTEPKFPVNIEYETQINIRLLRKWIHFYKMTILKRQAVQPIPPFWQEPNDQIKKQTNKKLAGTGRRCKRRGLCLKMLLWWIGFYLWCHFSYTLSWERLNFSFLLIFKKKNKKKSWQCTQPSWELHRPRLI